MCLIWGWGLWWIFGLSGIITDGLRNGKLDFQLFGNVDVIQSIIKLWEYRELSLVYIGGTLLVSLLYIGVFGSIIGSIIYCLLKHFPSSVAAIAGGIVMGIWGSQIMIALIIGFIIFVVLAYIFGGDDGDNWIGYIRDGFIHFLSFDKWI